jgi:hypothetical protein
METSQLLVCPETLGSLERGRADGGRRGRTGSTRCVTGLSSGLPGERRGDDRRDDAGGTRMAGNGRERRARPGVPHRQRAPRCRSHQSRIPTARDSASGAARTSPAPTRRSHRPPQRGLPGMEPAGLEPATSCLQSPPSLLRSVGICLDRASYGSTIRFTGCSSCVSSTGGCALSLPCVLPRHEKSGRRRPSRTTSRSRAGDALGDDPLQA